MMWPPSAKSAYIDHYNQSVHCSTQDTWTLPPRRPKCSTLGRCKTGNTSSPDWIELSNTARGHHKRDNIFSPNKRDNFSHTSGD